MSAGNNLRDVHHGDDRCSSWRKLACVYRPIRYNTRDRACYLCVAELRRGTLRLTLRRCELTFCGFQVELLLHKVVLVARLGQGYLSVVDILAGGSSFLKKGHAAVVDSFCGV